MLRASITWSPLPTQNSVLPPPMSTTSRPSIEHRQRLQHAEMDEARLLEPADHLDAARRRRRGRGRGTRGGSAPRGPRSSRRRRSRRRRNCRRPPSSGRAPRGHVRSRRVRATSSRRHRPAPSRTISFSLVSISNPPWSASRATTRCIELVPMSIAALMSDTVIRTSVPRSRRDTERRTMSRSRVRTTWNRDTAQYVSGGVAVLGVGRLDSRHGVGLGVGGSGRVGVLGSWWTPGSRLGVGRLDGLARGGVAVLSAGRLNSRHGVGCGRGGLGACRGSGCGAPGFATRHGWWRWVGRVGVLGAGRLDSRHGVGCGREGFGCVAVLGAGRLKSRHGVGGGGWVPAVSRSWALGV